jgi:hypothetical protein
MLTSVLSAITNSAAYILTNIPALYAGLTANKNNFSYVNTPALLRAWRWMVRGAGMTGDGAAMAISNFIGWVNTSHDIANIDPESCGVQAASVVPVLSNTVLNYFFSVHQGESIAYDNYHRDRGLLLQGVERRREPRAAVDVNNADPQEDIEERLPVLSDKPMAFYSSALKPGHRSVTEEDRRMLWEP